MNIRKAHRVRMAENGEKMVEGRNRIACITSFRHVGLFGASQDVPRYWSRETQLNSFFSPSLNVVFVPCGIDSR